MNSNATTAISCWIFREPDPDEGRAFTNELIDSEPNHLDAAFREQLFARTDGHPLFTVELLRNLQERGNLVKDKDGLLDSRVNFGLGDIACARRRRDRGKDRTSA